MQYRTLGRTGLKVSGLCLGTWIFGAQITEQQAVEITNAAWDGGINFIDTADMYHEGIAEEIVGRIFKGRRRDAVIATKVRAATGDGPNDAGLSRAHIMDACEDSLRRLQTDYIDLYQVHWPDMDTPHEETLRAMDDLVRQGKVRYIGVSNYPAWYLAEALWVSDARGLVRFDSVQPLYNLLGRLPEDELFPLCLDQEIAVIPYNPMAGGLLSGKHRRGQPPPEGTRFQVDSDLYMPRYWFDENFDAVERLVEVAAGSDKTAAQLALLWVMENPAVTSAIFGASRLSQLSETLATAEMRLSEDEKEALDGIRGRTVREKRDPRLSPA